MLFSSGKAKLGRGFLFEYCPEDFISVRFDRIENNNIPIGNLGYNTKFILPQLVIVRAIFFGFFPSAFSIKKRLYY
jgi:hypothetical protein